MAEIVLSSFEVKDHIKEIEQRLKIAKKTLLNRWAMPLIPSYSLKYFEFLYELGSGGFGRVLLVEKKDNGNQFALKIVEKQHLIKTDHVKHFKNEMRVLNSVRYRFLMNMSFYFVDNVYVYIGMQYVEGGELFTHLRLKGRFDEQLSKFYASQVILALEYLHYVGLIYRDLKPENILLERTGYIKLTDFGFSKMLSDSARTYSFCGTPEYMAPEIILSKGYSFPVDWWSLGILIYEMNAGYSPFRKASSLKLYEAIAKCSYKFPQFFSKELRSIISNLLVINPLERFGNLKNGVNDIKAHEWLKYYDWNGVFQRKLTPLYIPKPMLSDINLLHPKKDIAGLRTTENDEYKKEFKWLAPP